MIADTRRSKVPTNVSREPSIFSYQERKLVADLGAPYGRPVGLALASFPEKVTSRARASPVTGVLPLVAGDLSSVAGDLDPEGGDLARWALSAC